MEIFAFIGVIGLLALHMVKAHRFEMNERKVEERLGALETKVHEIRGELDELNVPPVADTHEDSAFIERINRIKDELARQDVTPRTGYSAEELHPSVHNLPHNTISHEHGTLPDVEYAE